MKAAKKVVKKAAKKSATGVGALMPNIATLLDDVKKVRRVKRTTSRVLNRRKFLEKEGTAAVSTELSLSFYKGKDDEDRGVIEGDFHLTDGYRDAFTLSFYTSRRKDAEAFIEQLETICDEIDILANRIRDNLHQLTA